MTTQARRSSGIGRQTILWWRGAVACWCLAALSGLAQAQGTAIDQLLPGEWHEFPNSRLSAVNPCQTASGNGCAWSGSSGFASVMGAWSGGAYDTTRDRLMVWGGGHQDYAGNEVYAFGPLTSDTPAWTRLTDPSTDVGGDSSTFVYPDGKPRSMHTYSYLEYVPPLDKFVSFGGVGPYPGVESTPRTFAFDLTELTWDMSSLATRPTGATNGGNAVYDPTVGNVWFVTGMGGARLTQYNPATNQWTTHAAAGYIQIYGMAALDTKRKRLVLIGGYGGQRQFFVFDLHSPDAAPTQPSSSGDPGGLALESAAAPGFAYDRASDRFVGWNGGAVVYTMDPVSWVWTRVDPAASNTAVPDSANSTGTYGRFRYVPSKGVFVVVNRTSSNVFVYRLTDIIFTDGFQ